MSGLEDKRKKKEPPEREKQEFGSWTK